MAVESGGFLETFLRHQLLDIGDDDGRFANLQAASQELAEVLKREPQQLSRYTRVGLDKQIDPNEPVLAEIEAAIQRHWRLIRNKHTDRPISIIRAVLWESVRLAADAEDRMAIIVLTAKAELPDANFGPEAVSCTGFLNDLATRIERIAENSWAGFVDPQFGSTKKNTVPVDTKLLAEKLLAACGPDGSEGPIKGGNPNWPTANAAWSTEFSKRAASGIAEVAVKHLTNAKSALESISLELATELRNVSTAVSRKTDLLWWAQSRYCLTLARGFDEISSLSLPFFLACDLEMLAPGICPQSVDHFLAHTVRTTVPETGPVSIHAFIESLLGDNQRDAILESIYNVVATPGRSGLVSFLKARMEDPQSSSDIKKRLASKSEQLSPFNLAKRVFWELKAMNIASCSQIGEQGE